LPIGADHREAVDGRQLAHRGVKRHDAIHTRIPTTQNDMTFMVLESAAVILTLLVAMEMRRQQLSWRSVLIGSLTVLGALTAMIAMWRGR